MNAGDVVQPQATQNCPTRPSVAAIIPTLNEAEHLPATLEVATRLEPAVEIIVVDGGSDDRTVELAQRFGAKTLTAPRGRGQQLAAGCQTTEAPILWFLHADSLPGPEAVQQIVESCSRPGVAGGYFAVRFDGTSRAARVLTLVYSVLQRFGLRYGDSAIFVRRDAYLAAGGFRPLPLFEDLDLLRRVYRQGRVVRIPSQVVTSSRRFEGRSFALTFAHWTLLQILFWLGVSPERLGRSYRAIRSPGRRGSVVAGSSR